MLLKEFINQVIAEALAEPSLRDMLRKKLKLDEPQTTPAKPKPEVEPEPEKFSLDSLKSLSTSKEKRLYIRKTLSELGRGQARAAYALGNDQIIKVALSDTKAYQNKNEVENAECIGPKYAIKVLSYDPEYVWVIEERVNSITSKELTSKLNEVLGLDNPKNEKWRFGGPFDVQEFFVEVPAMMDGTSDYEFFIERHNLLLKTSPWYVGFLSKVTGCMFDTSDFHYNNWGTRASTGELVLLDIGFSRQS
jgi:hypothetical protein